jgi:hypothetical protein
MFDLKQNSFEDAPVIVKLMVKPFWEKVSKFLKKN